MIVKVAPMGETVIEIDVESGTTIGDCLEVAGVDHCDRSITINNNPASLDTPVTEPSAIISLANKMKGGK